jgi:hypothetical protein
VKSTLIVAGLIGVASAGGFAMAAPASAACAPGFTSIPCTIVTNVAAAPVTTAGSLAAAPTQLASSLTAAPGQFVGVGCPADKDKNVAPCGITAVPGQFFGAGVNQIVTAPIAVAGGLLAAPGQLAASLAAAPGQFASAIQNGGTAVAP